MQIQYTILFFTVIMIFYHFHSLSFTVLFIVLKQSNQQLMSVKKYSNTYLRLSKINTRNLPFSKSNIHPKNNLQLAFTKTQQDTNQDQIQYSTANPQNQINSQQKQQINYQSQSSEKKNTLQKIQKKMMRIKNKKQQNNEALKRFHTIDVSCLQVKSNLLSGHDINNSKDYTNQIKIDIDDNINVSDKSLIKQKIKQRIKNKVQNNIQLKTANNNKRSIESKSKSKSKGTLNPDNINVNVNINMNNQSLFNLEENQVFNNKLSFRQKQLLNTYKNKNCLGNNSQKNKLNLLIHKSTNQVLDMSKLLSQHIQSKKQQNLKLVQDPIHKYNRTEIKHINFNKVSSQASKSIKFQRQNLTEIKKNQPNIKKNRQNFGQSQIPSPDFKNKSIALYNYFFKFNDLQKSSKKKIYYKVDNKSAPKYLIIYSLNETIQNSKLQLLQEQQKLKNQKILIAKKHRLTLESMKNPINYNKKHQSKIIKRMKSQQAKFINEQGQYDSNPNERRTPNLSPWLIT